MSTEKRRRRPMPIRIATIVAGVAIIVTGIIISPLPGPGLSILGPMGMALLATEFVWARRLMEGVMSSERSLRKAAERRLRMLSRIYIIPIIATHWVTAWSVAQADIIPSWLVWAIAGAFFTPVVYICYRLFTARSRRARVLRRRAVRARARRLLRSSPGPVHSPPPGTQPL